MRELTDTVGLQVAKSCLHTDKDFSGGSWELSALILHRDTLVIPFSKASLARNLWDICTGICIPGPSGDGELLSCPQPSGH